MAQPHVTVITNITTVILTVRQAGRLLRFFPNFSDPPPIPLHPVLLVVLFRNPKSLWTKADIAMLLAAATATEIPICAYTQTRAYPHLTNKIYTTREYQIVNFIQSSRGIALFCIVYAAKPKIKKGCFVFVYSLCRVFGSNSSPLPFLLLCGVAGIMCYATYVYYIDTGSYSSASYGAYKRDHIVRCAVVFRRPKIVGNRTGSMEMHIPDSDRAKERNIRKHPHTRTTTNLAVCPLQTSIRIPN